MTFTAKRTSGRNFMGFVWYEVFTNGESTGYSYKAINEQHAIEMHKCTIKQ